MTNIKKRHFCKSVALLSLVPLLKIDFLSANTNVQNSVLSGSVIVNDSLFFEYVLPYSSLNETPRNFRPMMVIKWWKKVLI